MNQYSDPRSVVLPGECVPTLRWQGDIEGSLWMIDQTLLPVELREIECSTVERVVEAIRALRVRGAPAIGVAAAYGVVVGMQVPLTQAGTREETAQRLETVVQQLAVSRPTAVNLFWALERMQGVARQFLREADEILLEFSPVELRQRLLAEARQIESEDRAMCAAIGRHGAPLLLSAPSGVLTHCNAGGLATAGDGTALAVIFEAARRGATFRVYADETRPLLQGARLTAWELQQRGIPVTVLCDNAAGWAMRNGKIDAVIVGADRISANGDAANKIGTYSVALLARAHQIPFYVAAPSSTFDLSLVSGGEIPIEERNAREITHSFGRQTVPDAVDVYNPAFDVTPASLIQGIITERGVISPVNEANVRAMIEPAIETRA